MEEEILMTSLLVSCHKAEMFWRKCYPYSCFQSVVRSIGLIYSACVLLKKELFCTSVDVIKSLLTSSHVSEQQIPLAPL